MNPSYEPNIPLPGPWRGKLVVCRSQVERDLESGRILAHIDFGLKLLVNNAPEVVRTESYWSLFFSLEPGDRESDAMSRRGVSASAPAVDAIFAHLRKVGSPISAPETYWLTRINIASRDYSVFLQGRLQWVPDYRQMSSDLMFACASPADECGPVPVAPSTRPLRSTGRRIIFEDE